MYEIEEIDEMTPIAPSERRLANFIRGVAEENSEKVKETWQVFNEITPEAERVALYRFAAGVADVQGALVAKLDELDEARATGRRLDKSVEYEFAVQSERAAARIFAVRGPVTPPAEQ